MSKRIIQMKKIQQEALELFEKKNTDYGDAFAEYGKIGILMRIGDKLKRYISIYTMSNTYINFSKVMKS
jgi:hypothetical protein